MKGCLSEAGISAGKMQCGAMANVVHCVFDISEVLFFNHAFAVDFRGTSIAVAALLLVSHVALFVLVFSVFRCVVLPRLGSRQCCQNTRMSVRIAKQGQC